MTTRLLQKLLMKPEVKKMFSKTRFGLLKIKDKNGKTIEKIPKAVYDRFGNIKKQT
tara:strand:- start:2766 stop:2933 length:168 start_codon:yes stop_codon:yes gene_type:complete